MSLSSHITKVNKVSLSDNFCISYKLLKSFNFSAKKEKSNRSLNKLTNGKLDNQSVNFPKNKEQEQEKKKDDGRKKEIKSPSPPSPVILFGRLFNFVVAAVVFFRVLPVHVVVADLFSVSGLLATLKRFAKINSEKSCIRLHNFVYLHQAEQEKHIRKLTSAILPNDFSHVGG